MFRACCLSCGKGFACDEESGLNMRKFEPHANNRGVFIGGVLPCCPHCDGRGHNPRVNESSTEVKYVKMKKVATFLPLRLREYE